MLIKQNKVRWFESYGHLATWQLQLHTENDFKIVELINVEI